MVARQFGFVVSRGLAVYALFIALNHIYAYFSLREMAIGRPAPSLFYLVGPVAMPVIYIVLFAILWTSANRFAGPVAEAEARVQSGAWVARLVLSGLGGFIALNALSDIANLFVKLNVVAQLQESNTENIAAFVVQIVKFLVGLGLILSNRFDRMALHEAARSGAPMVDAPAGP
ncbi:MAG: hypothetical protein IT203_05550 [Fimbriimonadaceae bacterium]|nr:hypothetical protein [Fimbriimonadaceae bacterium]